MLTNSDTNTHIYNNTLRDTHTHTNHFSRVINGRPTNVILCGIRQIYHSTFSFIRIESIDIESFQSDTFS